MRSARRARVGCRGLGRDWARTRPGGASWAPWCAAAIVAIAAAAPQPACAQHDDPWRGRDKRLHAGISAALAAGFYALSVPFVASRSGRAALGFAGAFSVGIAKELVDLTGAGTASGRDLAWDAAGALVGVGTAALIDFAVCRLRRRPEQTAHLTVSGLGLRWP